MGKHTMYKGYRVPTKSERWYNYFLGLLGDGDDVVNLIDLCISDDPMELMYRYLLLRRNRAWRNEDTYLEAYHKSGSKINEELYEFWKECSNQLQIVINFMTEVIGLDVLPLWGQATGEGHE